MTPKIALIIGIAATALAFGVPTGLAERQLVGLSETDGVAYFYANERATLASRATHRRGSTTHPRPPLSTRSRVTQPPRSTNLVRDRRLSTRGRVTHRRSGLAT